MRARMISDSNIKYSDLYAIAPDEIKDYIDRCEKTPQSPKWHPEGNVGIHNRIVFNRAVKHGDINLIMAAFFHDLGKADTTAPNKHGSFSAYGHEFVSAKLARKYKDWIESIEFGTQKPDAVKVHDIVVDHMRIKLIDQMKPAKQAILRASHHIAELETFTKFDSMSTLTPDELNV